VELLGFMQAAWLVKKKKIKDIHLFVPGQFNVIFYFGS
jgi:hypothetical protein